MFKKVQAEIRRLMYCHILPPNVKETTNVLPPGVEKFKVGEKLIVCERVHLRCGVKSKWAVFEL